MTTKCSEKNRYPSVHVTNPFSKMENVYNDVGIDENFVKLTKFT